MFLPSSDKALHNFSVQIFTSPVSTPKLVTDHSLLCNVFSAFEETIEPPRNADGILDFKHAHLSSHAELYWILEDMKYLLSNKAIVDWMLQDESCLYRWVRIHCSGQHSVPKRRITDKHVEREYKDFVSAFSFQIEMDQVSEPVVAHLRRNLLENVNVEATNQVLSSLLCFVREELEKSFSCALFGMDQLKIVRDISDLPEKYWVIDSNVLNTSFVSTHLPLQRLFADLLRLRLTTLAAETKFDNICEFLFERKHVLAMDVEKREEDVLFDWKKFVSRALELPVRLQVYLKQVSLGLWVRNGYSAQAEAIIYTTPCQDGAYMNFFEEDVALIQACGVLSCTCESVSGAAFFLTLLMEAFQLGSFFEETNFEPDSTENSMSTAEIEAKADAHKLTFGMCEAFLALVSHVLHARSRTAPRADRLREIVIHQLWVGKTSASKLTKLFPEQSKRVMEILQEVATFTEASGFKQGGYVLKKEFYKEYSPLFPFYSFEERQQADQLYMEYFEHEAKAQNKSVGEMEHISLSKPPEFFHFYKSLLNIYKSVVFHKVLFQLLMRAHTSPHVWGTRSILGTVLYLIQAAVWECDVNDSFLSLATEFLPQRSSLLVLLDLLNQSSQALEKYHSAIRWILMQLKRVAAFDAIITANLSVESMKKIDEKEIRRQKAAEARARALNKLQQTTDKLNLQLNNDENMDVVPDKEQVTECILCQENHKDLLNQPWGIVSCLTATSLDRLTSIPVAQREANSDFDFDICYSSCGHTMHHSCYEKHVHHLAAKHGQFETFEGDFLDSSAGFFVCPLCKRVSNTLLPLLHESLSVPLANKTNDSFTLKLSRFHEAYVQRKELVRSRRQAVAMETGSTFGDASGVGDDSEDEEASKPEAKPGNGGMAQWLSRLLKENNCESANEKAEVTSQEQENDNSMAVEANAKEKVEEKPNAADDIVSEDLDEIPESDDNLDTAALLKLVDKLANAMKSSTENFDAINDTSHSHSGLVQSLDDRLDRLRTSSAWQEILDGFAFKTTSFLKTITGEEEEFPPSVGFKFEHLEKCIGTTLDCLDVACRSSFTPGEHYYPFDFSMLKRRDLAHLQALVEYYCTLRLIKGGSGEFGAYKHVMEVGRQILKINGYNSFSSASSSTAADDNNITICTNTNNNSNNTNATAILDDTANTAPHVDLVKSERDANCLAEIVNVSGRQSLLNVVLLSSLVSGDSATRNCDHLQSALLALLRVTLLTSVVALRIVSSSIWILNISGDEKDSDQDRDGDCDALYQAFLASFLTSFPLLVTTSIAKRPTCSRFRAGLLSFLPDLRLCALMGLALAPPSNFEALEAFGGKGNGYPVEELTIEKEMDLLFQCLGVPSFADFLTLSPAVNAVDLRPRLRDRGTFLSKARHPRRYTFPFQLYPLPEKFDDFIQLSQNNLCAHVCLVCGEFIPTRELSFRSMRDGELVAIFEEHHETCVSPFSLFFGLLSNKIIAVTDQSVYYLLPTPYIDQFGEISNIRRRATLTLRPERYEKIRRIYVTQSIGCEDSLLLGRTTYQ